MKINKKLEKLIEITCSVPDQDNFGDEKCFINEINDEKYKASVAMARALRILSKNTVYETEIIELLTRCSNLLDFNAEDVMSDEEPLKTKKFKSLTGLSKEKGDF